MSIDLSNLNENILKMPCTTKYKRKYKIFFYRKFPQRSKNFIFRPKINRYPTLHHNKEEDKEIQIKNILKGKELDLNYQLLKYQNQSEENYASFILRGEQMKTNSNIATHKRTKSKCLNNSIEMKDQISQIDKNDKAINIYFNSINSLIISPNQVFKKINSNLIANEKQNLNKKAKYPPVIKEKEEPYFNITCKSKGKMKQNSSFIIKDSQHNKVNLTNRKLYRKNSKDNLISNLLSYKHSQFWNRDTSIPCLS